MFPLFNIILATIFVSLIALFASLALAISKKNLENILLVLVGLAAGSLIGASFFHLIPESLELTSTDFTFTILTLGFVLFFLLERLLWKHCHKLVCSIHSFAYLNIIGDCIHNFTDGLIIAASFLAETSLGIITTFAVALHEIPQELGDFGILIFGGFSVKKAIIYNFVTALFAIAGGLVGFLLSNILFGSVAYLLCIASGGFIYIASVDLMPELHKEAKSKKSIIDFISFLVGIFIMWANKQLGLG
jgi:zinc and cadmium transporter